MTLASKRLPIFWEVCLWAGLLVVVRRHLGYSGFLHPSDFVDPFSRRWRTFSHMSFTWHSSVFPFWKSIQKYFLSILISVVRRICFVCLLSALVSKAKVITYLTQDLQTLTSASVIVLFLFDMVPCRALDILFDCLIVFCLVLLIEDEIFMWVGILSGS